MEAWLRGKKLRLDPARSLGKGGEAEVFEAGPGRAVKIFKREDHADLAGQPGEQRAARERLDEHQTKLRAFPSGLPPQVVIPEALVTDRGGARVLGYEMRLVGDAEPLSRWAEPTFRRAGATQVAAAAILRELHGALLGLHAAAVVAGDLNDLNLLVGPQGLAIIDADSFQFGRYLSRVFTERFVDPLLCDPTASAPLLVKQHTTSSDWYAFAALLCQTLLCVGPHGGIHRPKNLAQRCPQPARALRRLSVFGPEVQYPRPATPLSVLSDDLLHELVNVFDRDARGVFPRRLLEALEFRRCPRCAIEHARAACPLCSPHAAAKVSATAVRGKVRCTLLARTGGAFVLSALQQGELRWLAHESGRFLREDGACVLEGPLDPALRFALRGSDTVVARGGETVILRAAKGLHRAGDAAAQHLAVDVRGQEPALAANGRRVVVCAGGLLQRDGEHGLEVIGEALAGRTRLWLGESLGLGLYDAGSLCVAFLFDPERRGLADGLALPKLRCGLVSAACVPGPDRAWLRLTSSEGGRLIHRACAYDRTGALLGEVEAGEGDEAFPWLEALGNGCAAGEALFVATDEGLVRIECRAGAICATQTFSDTEPLVDSASRLLAGLGGIVVTNRQEIRLLQMT